jgi:hypothetical protein
VEVPPAWERLERLGTLPRGRAGRHSPGRPRFHQRAARSGMLGHHATESEVTVGGQLDLNHPPHAANGHHSINVSGIHDHQDAADVRQPRALPAVGANEVPVGIKRGLPISIRIEQAMERLRALLGR